MLTYSFFMLMPALVLGASVTFHLAARCARCPNRVSCCCWCCCCCCCLDAFPLEMRVHSLISQSGEDLLADGVWKFSE